jgi:hypothetical protein
MEYILSKTDINQKYHKYFTDIGLKNVFLPLEVTGDSETSGWIAKSKHEMNRYANYLVLLRRYEKEPIDDYTCQAIHFNMAACSESIVFNLFNIFALITNTEASFYDTHISDYCAVNSCLEPECLYYLSFDWHKLVQSISNLVYSVDKKLQVCNKLNFTGFKIIDLVTTDTDLHSRDYDMKDFISSKDFFAIHLIQILSASDILFDLLYKGFKRKEELELSGQTMDSYYLKIENFVSLKRVFAEY